MINIAQLLEDAQKGMKLYSPLFGDVEYCYIGGTNRRIWVCTKASMRMFSMDGRYCFTHDGNTIESTECLLFPSKECRTWEDFKLSVEPKFKVGDWLVYKNGNFFTGGLTEAQVVKVKDGVYSFASGSTGSWKFIDENCRLWTIQDAKDGDVLSYQGEVFITRIARGLSANVAIDYDCCYDGNSFILDSFYSLTMDELKEVYPATKQQRDLLFAKMREAGYKWDADKKELRKIKPHYDIKNFKPFQKVLVRDADDGKWMAAFYSHYMYEEKDYPYQFATIGTDIYGQCIPFEGNEHLFRTTDMCDEQYINW